MENDSDEVLVEKSRAGDRAAFKSLVTRHEGKIAGVLHSMLGHTPDAEDVGQEVFIRFYDALNKFRGDSSVGTYLVKIAINLGLNELKRKKRAPTIPIDTVALAESFDDKMDLKEQLQYEFSMLDPEFKAVVTLRLIEGYSTGETADILGIPAGTVLSRLARAQHKLRQAMSKNLR